MRRHTAAVLLMLLPFAVAAVAQTTPSGGSIEFGPEQRVAPYRISASEASLQSAGVVEHGDGLLAVSWTSRAGKTEHAMATIDRTGRVDRMSEHPFESTHQYAAVASMGKRALMLWRDGQRGYVVSLLRLDGTLEDPNGIVLGLDDPPRIDCNATHCIAITTPAPAHARTTAIIIDSSARVVARVVLPLWSETMAVDPSGFLLRYDDDRELHFMRIGNDGAIIFDRAIRGVRKRFEEAADFDGSAYTVVHGGDVSFLVVRRITLNGSVGSPHVIPSRRRDNSLSGVALAWNGTMHLLAVASGSYGGIVFEGVQPSSNLYGVRLTGSLDVLDETPRLICNAPMQNMVPRVFPLGGGFYARWIHSPWAYSPAPWYIPFGTFVDADGDAAPHQPLVPGPVSQQALAIAAADSQSLAVWKEDDRLIERTILRAVRVRSGGEVLDTEPLTITDTDATKVRDVSAAAAGSDYLVAWTEEEPPACLNERRVAGAVVHADGSVQHFTTNYFGGGPIAVASDGTGWLLASSKYQKALRVTRTGLVAPDAKFVGDFGSRVIALASNGDGFLLLDSEYPGGGCRHPMCLVAVPLKSDGTAARPPQGTMLQPMYMLAMASNGRDYLAVAQAYDSIQVVRLSPAGTLLAGPYVAARLPAGYRDRIAVSRLGSGWLVTWTGDRGSGAMPFDEDGIPSEALPLPASTSIVAVAAKSDTSIVALGAKVIDDVVATVWQELVVTPGRSSRGRQRPFAH